MDSFYRYFGLAGSLTIWIAVGVSAVFYVGRNRERFTIWNHFISELGQVGVSRLAGLFNGGLIAGGLLLMPFVIGLGLSLDTLWGKLGLLAGLGASGACVAIGLLPMNRLAPHTAAAMAFFRLGLMTIVLFSAAIWTQPGGRVVVPRAANGLGGLAIAAYSAFLILASFRPVVRPAQDVLNPAAIVARPRFWPLAILEWAVFLATHLWFMGVALTLLG